MCKTLIELLQYKLLNVKWNIIYLKFELPRPCILIPRQSTTYSHKHTSHSRLRFSRLANPSLLWFMLISLSLQYVPFRNIILIYNIHKLLNSKCYFNCVFIVQNHWETGRYCINYPIRPYWCMCMFRGLMRLGNEEFPIENI